MKTGSLTPVSIQAMMEMDRISKILTEIPKKEWEFVLKHAKAIAVARIADAKMVSEEIKAHAREQSKRQKRKS